MNKNLKIFCSLLVIKVLPSFAATSNNCFIAKENGKIVKQVGKCDVRHSPFSTFKIALAIMGFDAGILENADSPEVKFTPEIDKKYITYFDPQKFPNMLLWKRNQTPKSWMRDSIVWYSRFITHKLGAEKFQDYVNKFNYGNKNVAGDPGKNNGLMDAWIQNSLKISPMEQIEFIEKLVTKTLPVTKEAQEKTIEIIKMETVYEDFQLYGKTGGGKFGWFVGWIEKDGRRIICVQYIEQREDSLIISGGKIAKELAKENLINLLVK